MNSSFFLDGTVGAHSTLQTKIFSRTIKLEFESKIMASKKNNFLMPGEGILTFVYTPNTSINIIHNSQGRTAMSNILKL